MKTIRELREKKARLIVQARAVLETAERENREATVEERQQFDGLFAEAERLDGDIARMEQLEREEARMAEFASVGERPETGGKVEHRASKEYAQAYERYLRGGLSSLTGDDQRALQADNPVLGGYLLAPQTFVSKLIKAIDDETFIRSFATVYEVNGSDSLGAASLDADPADADWTGEITSVGEDSTMAFGKRELKPSLLTKLVKVSMKLINRVPSAEDLVASRLGYKFAISQEKAFMTGNGVGAPLGVFVASADGIPTSRDVATDNAQTAFTADGLMNAKYALKAGYWRNARWIMHRDAVKMAAKLKDGEGRYLFDVDSGTLLGFPLHTSEYAPNTFTAGLYVGILGDFSNYWIADGMSYSVQRLVELYARTNQVGLIGRMELDGMPVLGEAFVRVTLAP